MKKKEMVKDALKEEFQSSFGVNASVPDPVDVGDTHAGRAADQVSEPDNKPEAYEDGQPGTEPPTPRTEILAHLFDQLHSMGTEELSGMYAELAKLGGIGADAHAGRTADQSTSEREPERYAEDIREDVKLVLKNTNLDEATIDRAANLFEAAVTSRVMERMVELQGRMDEELQEQIEAKCGEIEERNAQYMDYVAEQWYEDNKLSIESGIRTELAESFLSGLKELFDKHYVDIPEDKVNVVESLAAEVQELRARLDEAEDKLIEQENVAQQNEELRDSLVVEASVGLTELEKDRLKQLAESVEFDATRQEEFSELLQTLREDFVVRPVKRGDAESMLTEEVEIENDNLTEDDYDSDPTIAQLAKQVGRLGGRVI